MFNNSLHTDQLKRKAMCFVTASEAIDVTFCDALFVILEIYCEAVFVHWWRGLSYDVLLLF